MAFFFILKYFCLLIAVKSWVFISHFSGFFVYVKFYKGGQWGTAHALSIALVQFSSVAQLCRTLWDHMDCSMLGFPVHHQLPELAQTMSTESVMSSKHFILCRPLIFLLSIFASIRVFSNESVLHIRWSKYWSFSFSGSPSHVYSGLVSF